MDVQILTVPYDSGVPGVRMGKGPARILEAGLRDHLASGGHRTWLREIDAETAPVPSEVSTALGLLQRLSSEVTSATVQGRLPLVLAGSCYTAVGTVTGVRAASPASDRGDAPGVVWLDCHGDFNTPETTSSGFIDGMALAMLTGRCWKNLTVQVPGFSPVPEDHVSLLGCRDLDPSEADLLYGSAVTVQSPDDFRKDPGAALARLAARTDRIYLHFDLDVLDPSEAPANALARPGGFGVAEACALVGEISRRFAIGAVAFTAYDPSIDPAGDTCRALFDVVDALLG